MYGCSRPKEKSSKVISTPSISSWCALGKLDLLDFPESVVKLAGWIKWPTLPSLHGEVVEICVCKYIHTIHIKYIHTYKYNYIYIYIFACENHATNKFKKMLANFVDQRIVHPCPNILQYSSSGWCMFACYISEIYWMHQHYLWLEHWPNSPFLPLFQFTHSKFFIFHQASGNPLKLPGTFSCNLPSTNILTNLSKLQ